MPSSGNNREVSRRNLIRGAGATGLVALTSGALVLQPDLVT
jgi:TAT (twin-arginine translocation) pathway signal sequence